jgi:hypothetical protein
MIRIPSLYLYIIKRTAEKNGKKSKNGKEIVSL